MFSFSYDKKSKKYHNTDLKGVPPFFDMNYRLNMSFMLSPFCVYRREDEALQSLWLSLPYGLKGSLFSEKNCIKILWRYNTEKECFELTPAYKVDGDWVPIDESNLLEAQANQLINVDITIDKEKKMSVASMLNKVTYEMCVVKSHFFSTGIFGLGYMKRTKAYTPPEFPNNYIIDFYYVV